MRKNISTYNHKKFAQAVQPKKSGNTSSSKAKVNFKDPKYINKILLSQNAPQQLAYLAVRAIYGDDNLAKLNRNDYDVNVFALDKINNYIEFINSLTSVKGIDAKNLQKHRQTSIDILTSKVVQNRQPNPMAGPGSGTGVTQQNQQVPQAPSMLSPALAAEQAQITPEQADKYLSNIIPELEEMSANKEKIGEFTQRYSNEYNYIINSMSVLRNDPKFFEKLKGYNTKFKTLAPIYNNAMHPTGWTAAGNSVFVTDWYTLGDQIINDAQGKKSDEAKKKLTTFQTEFLNKNPKNTDISGVANKVNQFLDQYNTSGFGKTNILPRLK